MHKITKIPLHVKITKMPPTYYFTKLSSESSITKGPFGIVSEFVFSENKYKNENGVL